MAITFKIHWKSDIDNSNRMRLQEEKKEFVKPVLEKLNWTTENGYSDINYCQVNHSVGSETEIIIDNQIHPDHNANFARLFLCELGNSPSFEKIEKVEFLRYKNQEDSMNFKCDVFPKKCQSEAAIDVFEVKINKYKNDNESE